MNPYPVSAALRSSAPLLEKIAARGRRWTQALARRDDELTRTRGLFKLILEDLKRHMWDTSLPGFRALAVYRFGVWARTLRFLPLRILFIWLHTTLFRFIRNNYGIELYASAKVGRRFLIGHQSGIVIHRFATFGNDCVIRQNVTLGEAGKGRDNFSAGLGPVIGDDVDIGAGVVIIGNVRIGDNVRIGPNAVVLTNIPSNATVLAPVSRAIVREPLASSEDSTPQEG